MSIKLGVVMDPIQAINIKKDTTFAMLLEAQRRQWIIYYFEPHQLGFKNGVVFGHAKKLTVQDHESQWFSFEENVSLSLADLNLILMRKDPPFDQAYLDTTYLLDHAVQQGVLVVNHPQGLRDANEKLLATHFPTCYPPQLVSASIQELMHFRKEHDAIVCKPLHGRRGESVFHISAQDPNASAIFENLTHQGQRLVMVQTYLPQIVSGDKRIILINGKPISHALARIPHGDWRGNLAAGAIPQAQLLSKRDLEICDAVGENLRKRGLYFVGLDVIGDYLTEINVTSPTGVRELDAQLGMNIAGIFFDKMENYLSF